MRIWKLKACERDESIGIRWGYAIAATATEAITAGRESSGLPVIRTYETRDGMLWPGTPGHKIVWTS